MSLTANAIKAINSCNVFGTYYTALQRVIPCWCGLNNVMLCLFPTSTNLAVYMLPGVD